MFSDPFSFVTYIREHPDQFLRLLTQHLQLTILSILIAVAVAIPLAVLASRVELVAKPMTWFAGVGQTIPSLAILGLMLPFGIRGADRAVVDAARGMGANNSQMLLLVQLPLASPVIFAGIQTATVQNIGVATLAAYIGAGGLGDLILQGMAMVDPAVLLAGAIPVALLAMTAEVLMGLVRRFVVPVGLRIGLAR
jgi:osmoprotectant transport system permease protein